MDSGGGENIAEDTGQDKLKTLGFYEMEAREKRGEKQK